MLSPDVLTAQADKIRQFDTMLHPLISAGIGMLPPEMASEAKRIDDWLFKLLQTPTLLEQVLEILPLPATAGDLQEPKKGG